ncbi:MAG TPA: acetyl-CoA carboxylase biotin carboxylase subunit [Bacteroidales bacterium]|nr:acetyl-CoA carboxylase biotin carboxylase subunit [Bacteroidales bacterium]HPF03121.1 acetyl-CoA carboxylase biotin carboxylase subunit [Bacteroidales bacterium]HPJ58559.1 acetyl-CoA carboxylase biotin carboxylase subunit [Bacteroidales bacterium]HPR11282.1 acetyl-CoA carboxylase biotin carboxylase subunit [Bacteroidales bacterium]HRW86371.1 acetyl-CoA carboxylase biotin carboxylase subunit [Bacteroidales bacterium]
MKIKKILIANRGEIAIRIMKTARKLKILTVAVRTSAEPNAMYLSHADEIFDNTESESEIPVFLDIEKLISIALQTSSDALHPGYGFLAENAYFAQKCLDNGIIFIGPSPDAIYKMGNKTIARKLALRSGIPMATGSEGNIANSEEAVSIAEKIGYPVIIKAASGGGGRGMRIVRKAEEMEKMFTIASKEAEKAFNDPSVFIEKYIENPKHIEFQILGDKHGNIIHLGERECSIQRKHQKLLEEAPSCALDKLLRKKMGQMAVRIAKAVDYFSAGTVEFLLDSDRNFYFMEMNTRIQVEHPVTEVITGIDLIEQQIKIANGEELVIRQDDVKLKGWAIECRINAEDVQAGFAPDPGKIEKLNLPSDKYVRIDTGIQEGSSIVSSYDSLIAKLIVSGKDRKEAIKNCKMALDKVWIKGTKTTLPFFRLLVRNQKFQEGSFTTAFIEKDLDRYYYNSEYEEMLAAWLTTKLFVEENLQEKNTGSDDGMKEEMSPWLLNKRITQF